MRCLLALLSLMLASPGWSQPAADAPVVVRTTIRPESGAVVGQQVLVWVDVLFRDGMVRPPRVSIPEIAGAQLVRFETQATTMSERIDGRDYAGQRFEFALYARRGGTFTVPAPVATLLDTGGNAIGSVTGAPATVEIAVPPGVDAAQPVIATTRASLQESWTPPGRTSFEAGDAVVRTIVRQAADVPSMAMPDLAFPAPAGVRVYVEQPQADDTQARGEVTGRRTDRITYVFESAGAFALPAVAQPWWDLGDGRLRIERGPGLAVTVAAAAPPPLPLEDRVERWVFLGATTLGLLALLAWGVRELRGVVVDRHARWLASEGKARADMLAACRRGDVRALYAAFVVWRGRMPPDRNLRALAEELEAVLYAGAPWSTERAQDFAQKVEAVRHVQSTRSRSVLPPLNPARTARG